MTEFDFRVFQVGLHEHIREERAATPDFDVVRVGFRLLDIELKDSWSVAFHLMFRLMSSVVAFSCLPMPSVPTGRP